MIQSDFVAVFSATCVFYGDRRGQALGDVGAKVMLVALDIELVILAEQRALGLDDAARLGSRSGWRSGRAGSKAASITASRFASTAHRYVARSLCRLRDPHQTIPRVKAPPPRSQTRCHMRSQSVPWRKNHEHALDPIASDNPLPHMRGAFPGVVVANLRCQFEVGGQECGTQSACCPDSCPCTDVS
jgi:hypothetical protein